MHTLGKHHQGSNYLYNKTKAPTCLVMRSQWSYIIVNSKVLYPSLLGVWVQSCVWYCKTLCIQQRNCEMDIWAKFTSILGVH